jgi:hypothetical protein
MEPARSFRPVSFLVDPSMYGERYAPPRDVYGDVDQVVRPDLYYHYSTPICAQRWLDVCEDPDYGHGELLSGVQAAMPDVAAAIRRDSGGKGLVALCSLGPGDGSVDERMIEGLSAAFGMASYTGLDFSFELLRRSVHRIARSPSIPRDFAVTAVCGDFTGLGALTVRRGTDDVARVFALTGFTFGNYPELALLEQIGGLMGEGDYLFLDARLHGHGPLGDTFGTTQPAMDTPASYDVEPVRRFVFGPLEVATTAVAADVEISFELTRSQTTIPSALNLVIFCSGLDTTVRLTGARVRRDRLDLAVTTSYHLPDLQGWLDRTGFTTVWRGTGGDTAFFLLKR